MSNINLVDKDQIGPGTSICPHCKRKMMFNLGMFKNNISKIVESKCPYCGGKIFSCIVLFSNTNLNLLLNNLKGLIGFIKGERSSIKI